jgi:hypothetical protein
MKLQGTLKYVGKEVFMHTKYGDFSIHSIIDTPKVKDLPVGTILNGTIRDYDPKQIKNLGWGDRVGSVEPGHLHVGALKE